MNAIIENLLTRRSTRAFLQKEIPDNELNEILQAAIYAPSGMGKQTQVYGSLQSGKNPATGRTHRTKTWTKGL